MIGTRVASSPTEVTINNMTDRTYYLRKLQRKSPRLRLAEATHVPQRGHRESVALAPNQLPCRILIVEDQPQNRQGLWDLLTIFGFDLREAQDGREPVDIESKTYSATLAFAETLQITMNLSAMT